MIGKRTLTFFASLLLAIAPLAAIAGQVNVSPVRFTFPAGQTIGTLTLQNVGADPLRMQLKVFAWTQNPDGSMRLAPTEDVVIFPTLLTIAPAGMREIRVGYTGPKSSTERTYRIFAEELPSLEGAQKGVALNVRTRVGIPIFVQPPSAQSKGRITDVAVRRDHIQVDLANDGTASFMANTVAVRAIDGAGNAVVSRQQPGWYVLAGEHRTYDFSIPMSACSRIRGVALDIKTESGAILRETRPVQSTCS